MDGILLVDKPSNWTSHDVVAKVRSLIRSETGLKKPKVGHGGTLDPLAAGLLIILVGTYCKKAQEFLKLDKTYEVELSLGQISTTDDEEGNKSQVSELQPSGEKVKEVIDSFLGSSMQTPPQFSAIKVKGKRSYKRARAGEMFQLEPRPITIYEINDVTYKYPNVSFTTRVASGTYIRSLARDIGEKLGTGAYMSNLRRTMIGSFTLDSAQKIQDNELALNISRSD